MSPQRRNRTPLVSSRLILVAGFGGLLLLMSFAGLDGIQALQQIQSSNDTIRADFLQRTRVLERIRGDLYLSGTYVRDYLLEPESGKADGHRYSLLETRGDMDAALGEYRGLLSAPERAPFEVLTRELPEHLLSELSSRHARVAREVMLLRDWFGDRRCASTKVSATFRCPAFICDSLSEAISSAIFSMDVRRGKTSSRRNT